MIKKTMAALMVLGLASVPGIAAAEFDQSKLYVGGGLGSNSLDDAGIDYDRAMGFQIFAGYPLENLKLGEGVASFVEAGYMDSGKFDYSMNLFGTTVTGTVSAAKGIWVTYVATYDLNDQMDLVGRVGLDFGDDDGLMFGGGVDYKLNEQMSLRGEYVIRDNISSLQGNVVYRFD